MLLEKLAGDQSKLSQDDKAVLQQVRSAAAAEVDSDEKTRAQKFLKLIITELKDGREVTHIIEPLAGKGQEICNDLFNALNKPNMECHLVQDKQITTLPKLVEKLKDETFRKELFQGNQFAQDCINASRKSPVAAYNMTCSEDVPQEIKDIIEKWGTTKFDGTEDGCIRQELSSQEQDSKTLHGEYTAHVMSNLYQAMETNSEGSGAQLLYLYCQTVDGTVFAEHFKHAMVEKKIWKDDVNFQMKAVQENENVIPIKSLDSPGRIISIRFAGNNPITITCSYHVDCKFVICGKAQETHGNDLFPVSQIVSCVVDVEYSYENNALKCSANCFAAVSEDGVRAVNMAQKGHEKIKPALQ